MKTSVLLVDDHAMLRDGLRSLLERQSHIDVVGEASDGRAAVDLARKLEPDVVIMDVALSELNGIEATREITGSCRHTRVIALSMHSDRRYFLRMFRAGAAAYLLKEAAGAELVSAIDAVARGETVLSPAVAGSVVHDLVHGETEVELPLSARERQVLQLVAEGHTSQQIAGTLSISPKTVESHRQAIMRKLSIHSVADLTKYAVREGLTPLEPPKGSA